MSDNTFSLTQNEQNAASTLDQQISKAAQPGDQFANTAHDALLALQNDAIPTGVQAQVHADLLKLDPQADAKLKAILPDFTLTDSAGGSTMHVTDNNAPSDTGTAVMRDVAMQAGGEIFSTNKISALSQQELANYGGASAEGEAAAFVNNDLQLLGVTNEQVVTNDKKPGFFGELGAAISVASDPNAFVGAKGEYDLVNKDGGSSKIGTYAEKMPNEQGDFVNIQGIMVATPGNELVMSSTQTGGDSGAAPNN